MYMDVYRELNAKEVTETSSTSRTTYLLERICTAIYTFAQSYGDMGLLSSCLHFFNLYLQTESF